MPIQFKHGDLFAQDVEAIVNTVNCVGVMGKGVALEFKRKFPDNYAEYKRQCNLKKLAPGKLLIYPLGDLFADQTLKYIVNFPTKVHWRSKSKIEYIEAGLDTLADEIDARRIRSIAMPPLGCGNGGLDWTIVKELIRHKLSGVNCDVIVLEPISNSDSPEQSLEPVSMTLQRATLFKTLAELEDVFLGGFDRLSLQKIVYLLQALGLQYSLNFDRRLFGPYSYDLKRAYEAFERMGLIKGFNSQDRISHVTPGGYAIADEFLDKTGQREFVEKVVRKLSHLIDGYESPYGLELLTSVHHLAKSKNVDESRIVGEIGDWNEIKRNKFAPAAIAAAYQRLKEDKVL